jgi:hypothetical protein
MGNLKHHQTYPFNNKTICQIFEIITGEDISVGMYPVERFKIYQEHTLGVIFQLILERLGDVTNLKKVEIKALTTEISGRGFEPLTYVYETYVLTLILSRLFDQRRLEE